MLDESIRFKFQSDSINTQLATGISYKATDFKFQSDSINTDFSIGEPYRRTTLNSNLILLIRVQPVV